MPKTKTLKLMTRQIQISHVTVVALRRCPAIRPIMRSTKAPQSLGGGE